MKKKISQFCLLLLIYSQLFAQHKTKQAKGIQIITSGGTAADSTFIQLIGGPDAKLVFIPTAASSLRSDSGIIWNPDEEKNKNEFKQELLRRFKLNDLIIVHTRNRQEANTASFAAPLQHAKAVWISGGNAGRFMAAYKGTRFEKELNLFLQRGGIIGGESAGAIVQGSYTVRGNPDKPVLMMPGSEQGLGLLHEVAINPHLSAQKRENELVSVIDKYPALLGIGVDDNAGFIIKDGIGEVFGTGRIAIYTNKKYKTGWYYWLKRGDRFDFIKRIPVNFLPE